jgi:hypothetical protein
MRALLVILLPACASVAAAWSSIPPQEERKLEKFYGAKYVHVTDAEHARLVRGAIRAQQTGICTIHHIQMQKKRVPIYFGLLVFEDAYYSAELAHFPNAQEHVNGGCEVDSCSPEAGTFKIRLSQKCKRAQRQWAIAHPKSDWSKDILAKR